MDENNQPKFFLFLVISIVIGFIIALIIGLNQLQAGICFGVYYVSMVIFYLKINWIEKPWEQEFIFSDEMSLFGNSFGEKWIVFREIRYDIKDIASFIEHALEFKLQAVK